MKFLLNRRASGRRERIPSWIAPYLSLERHAEAKREIQSWPGYAPTPLHALDALARELGIARVWYKDEGPRFGLKSFKALGGAYAGGRAMLRTLIAKGQAPADATLADLRAGKFADAAAKLTLVTATDGNHGKSVAWGASIFGARAIIYIHRHVSAAREVAIGALGADIVRVDGNYDDSVRRAAADARANGYLVVSDTTYEDYVETPSDVMQGYTVMLGEIFDDPAVRPTHVFVQAGVGAFAAAVAAHLWELLGRDRPTFVVVESTRADCLLKSAEAGRPVVVEGDLDTIMAGLACGEVSDLAWKIVDVAADAFVAIGDESARQAMRRLFDPSGSDSPIVAGESGAAGLAALLSLSEEAKGALRLGPSSRVLLFGTESDTDPASFAKIVGRPAESIGKER